MLRKLMISVADVCLMVLLGTVLALMWMLCVPRKAEAQCVGGVCGAPAGSPMMSSPVGYHSSYGGFHAIPGSMFPGGHPRALGQSLYLPPPGSFGGVRPVLVYVAPGPVVGPANAGVMIYPRGVPTSIPVPPATVPPAGVKAPVAKPTAAARVAFRGGCNCGVGAPCALGQPCPCGCQGPQACQGCQGTRKADPQEAVAYFE